jgi:predicted Zn-dependent protease
MARWIQWYLLARLTGSPIGALLVLLAAWWVLDRLTLRVLPDPLRMLARWRRSVRLRRILGDNPHDRRARLELADLLVGRRRHRAAVDVLRSNIEAGDDDPVTLFVMGTACAGAGFREQAEVFFAEARKAEPHFRAGQIDLELGRMRLAGGDAAGARIALEALLVERPSSVEGRYLLSRVFASMGDHQGAGEARALAWQDYAAAPSFQRRRERFWAWRAKPWRPAVYLALALLCGVAIAEGAKRVLSAPGAGIEQTTGDPGAEDPPPGE